MAVRLFSNVTSNTDSNSIQVTGFVGSVYAFGTFNGATVAVQCSADNLNWLEDANVAFTQNTVRNLDVTGFIRGNCRSVIGSQTNVNLIMIDKR